MPVKGNQFKSNSFKEDNEPRQSSKSEKEKYVKPKRRKCRRSSFNDGQVGKNCRLVFPHSFCIFLVAFTSYLFTWQQDQSYVSHANGGWHNLFKTTQELMDNGIKTRWLKTGWVNSARCFPTSLFMSGSVWPPSFSSLFFCDRLSLAVQGKAVFYSQNLGLFFLLH